MNNIFMTTILYMPDGNRRFSRENGVSLSEAYYLGGKTLKLCSQFFLVEERAKVLIYHALSNYTYRRTDLSLDPIFEATTRTFEDLTREDFFRKNGIKFKVIDHSGKLPVTLKKATETLSSSTTELNEKECIVLLGYSLDEDINSALSLNPVDYKSLRKSLIFSDIDLVLRPLEMRASGGPVYAMSNAQMITLSNLNPEVSRKDLEQAWEEYIKLRDNKERGNPSHYK